jgi:hypothetical protein
MLMETHVDWTSPAPLWDQFNGPANPVQRQTFLTPAVVGFATDRYMDELIALMSTEPHKIAARLAVPETWRQRVPPPEPVRPKGGLIGKLERARAAAVRKIEARQGLVRVALWNPAAEQPLKLYHPAAQRYYLVAACLVCRTVGLPDRPIHTNAKEKAAFVLRMLLPPEGTINPDPRTLTEYALAGNEWKAVANAGALVAGEEQYLMSPLMYTERDGRRRRLFTGVIPVAKREALLAASTPPQPGGGAPPPAAIDPRRMMLKLQVVGPWSNLEEVAQAAADAGSAAPGTDVDTTNRKTALDAANNQIQNISWLILLDLARWLQEHLPAVWDAVQHGRGVLGDTRHFDAYDALNKTVNGHSLIAALRDIEDSAASLEAAKKPYPQADPDPKIKWPANLFQFITATSGGPAGLTTTALRDAFETALADALVGSPAASVPVPAITHVNASDHVSPWFTARCVLDRPECGPLKPAIVSEPTASFQLASYFDPDAPARPIRVEMPADTSPAGLRKFDKNTAFVMSDILCGQVSGIRGTTFGDLVRSVLPWPFHKDLGGGGGGFAPCTGGMVCSFSIPIITLCALILLMIIVKLLDIVFFWLPFFQICLPVPKFDAKKG